MNRHILSLLPTLAAYVCATDERAAALLSAISDDHLDRLIDKDFSELNLYIKNKSAAEIAEKCYCDVSTVARRVVKQLCDITLLYYSDIMQQQSEL